MQLKVAAAQSCHQKQAGQRVDTNGNNDGRIAWESASGFKLGIAAAVALLAVVGLAAYTWGRPLAVSVATVEKDVPIQV